jgi:hypothetical protein
MKRPIAQISEKVNGKVKVFMEKLRFLLREKLFLIRIIPCITQS